MLDPADPELAESAAETADDTAAAVPAAEMGDEAAAAAPAAEASETAAAVPAAEMGDEAATTIPAANTPAPPDAVTESDRTQTASAWLALLCGMVDGAARGVVLAPMRGGPTRQWHRVAQWPSTEAETPRLVAVAEAADDKGRTVVRPHVQPGDGEAASIHDVAHPIARDGEVAGIVALEVTDCPESRLPDVVRQIQTATSYLPLMLAPTGPQTRAPSASALESALWLVGSCLEHDRFRGAATAVATDMATQLDCERVSIGFVDGEQTKVQALSHSADFSERMNLIRRIGSAMDEAVDQQTSVVYPPLPGRPVLATSAHEELAKEEGAGAACTVLLNWNEEIIGAVTLERDVRQPFPEPEVEVLEDTTALLGPILELKRRDDRWFLQKALDSCRTQARKLVGPKHVGFKAAAIGVVLLALYMSVATGTFRVTAPATLEGAVMRVAAAPLDGFIVDAPVRPGDLVSAGDVLCILDDRDLRLEQRALQSQRDQIESEYLEAMARQERVEMNLLQTRIEQTEVQLDLVAEQLDRLRIVAPIDGIVVSGDLSQSIGAPVQQGDVLFEVAPLDAYRLMLKVDERDVAYVHPEQRGNVVLASLPETTHAFTVDKVTPVSTSEEGTSYFLVEASLDEALPSLRPGMEGVGKVDIDRYRRIWILTRRITDWLRLWVWSWRGPGG